MLPNDHKENFLRRVHITRRLLARQLNYFNDGALPRRELEAIFEIAFLQIFIAFETQVSELFKTNLMMATDARGKIRSNFPVSSRSQAGRLLQGTNKYVQLFPIEQMERIAKVYLKNGGPFVSLTDANKLAIGKAYAIRNHIAHKSGDSLNSYRKKVLNTVNLPRNSTSPGYYLRSQLTSNVSYFDHHISQIGACLNHLCLQST